jgi:CBS domain-containing protein
MNVSTMCQRLLFTILPADEVIRAAQVMREKHVGYLVVVEPQEGGLRPVGVLTDRDIVVAVVAREVDPAVVRVGEIMTPNPVTVAATASIEQAFQELRRAGVRRAPVVGQRGELVGVLSFDDLLKVIAGETQDLVGAIRTGRQIEGMVRS